MSKSIGSSSKYLFDFQDFYTSPCTHIYEINPIIVYEKYSMYLLFM